MYVHLPGFVLCCMDLMVCNLSAISDIVTACAVFDALARLAFWYQQTRQKYASH